MTLRSEVQKLELSGFIELYDLDGGIINAGMMRFHCNPAYGSIWWQGNEYEYWNVDASGFSKTTEQQSRPRLRVLNQDSRITALVVAFEDLVGCIVTRRRTYVKFLDAVNFAEGNPTADSEQEIIERYVVGRKIAETGAMVEFELHSPIEFGGKKIPGRQIVANYCPWRYRGPGCMYAGPPVATINGEPTSDPALDRCGKKVGDCKKRQWADGVLNFGGFPAAGLVR